MRNPIGAFVVVEIVILSGPLMLESQLTRPPVNMPSPLLPLAEDGWAGPTVAGTDSAPTFEYARDVLSGIYKSEFGSVELHIAFYSDQSQGKELVSRNNQLYKTNSWRIASVPESEPIDIESGRSIQPGALEITDGKNYLLLWYWYDVDGLITRRPGMAKLFRAWSAFAGKDSGDAIIVISTRFSDKAKFGNAETIKAFLQQHGTSILTCLRRDETEGSECSPPTDN